MWHALAQVCWRVARSLHGAWAVVTQMAALEPAHVPPPRLLAPTDGIDSMHAPDTPDAPTAPATLRDVMRAWRQTQLDVMRSLPQPAAPERDPLRAYRMYHAALMPPREHD